MAALDPMAAINLPTRSVTMFAVLNKDTEGGDN